MKGILVNRIIYLIVLVIICWPIDTFAQSNRDNREYINFEHIAQEQGLSSNSVTCIYQDRQGFLWIGTEYGLNRYDGHNFKIYRNSPNQNSPISGNKITTIFQDRNETLWVGTADGGLNRYNRNKDIFEVIQSELLQTSPTSAAWVLSICQDSNNIIWLGTNNGLIRYDLSNNKFASYSFNDGKKNSFTGVLEDRYGNLWISSQRGLHIFDRQKEQFIPVVIPSSLPVRTLNLNGLLLHPNGNLYFASWDGLYLVDTKQQKVLEHFTRELDNPNSLSDNSLQCLLFTDENTLWIGTYGGGLNRFDLKKRQFTVYRPDSKDPNSLSGENIMALYQDRSGVIWVGDRIYGLNKFSQYRKKFRRYANLPYQANSLSNNYIRGMCEDSAGYLWIGTQFGGLNRYDHNTGDFMHYRHNPKDPASLANDEVWAVLEDHARVLWVGTNPGGLQSLDRNTGKFTNFALMPDNAYVNVIFEDKALNLWVGTTQGVFCINPERNQIIDLFQNHSVEARRNSYDVQAIFQDRAGDIWFGINTGFMHYHPDTKAIELFQKELGIQNTDGVYVNSFWQDPEGNIWMATKGVGLLVYDIAEKTITHIDESQGLPHNNAYGLISDNRGNLWISTDNGIAKLDLATRKFDKFNQADGLQSKEFNRRAFCQTRRGEIFFGGINGLNSFYPDQILKNQNAPTLVITSFAAAGISVPDIPYNRNRSIELQYYQNSITINFAALDFNDPQNNLYSYWLSGFDPGWQDGRNKNAVTYQNLPDGDYTFYLKGSNNNGVWAKEPLKLQIKILPPIWRTFWAYIFYLLIITVLLAALLRYQAGRFNLRLAHIQTQALERENQQRAQNEAAIKQKNIELEEANLKLKELDQLKANFTAMMVHDLKSPLTAVSATLQLLSDEPTVAKGKMGNLVSVSEKNLDKVVRLVNEALEFYRSDSQEMKLNCQAIKLSDLLNNCLESAQISAQAKEISIELLANSELPKVSADAGKLERVFTNLLGNAIKFTPRKGQVIMEVTITSGTGVETGLTFVNISVTDNGEGIPAEEIPYLFDPYQQGESKEKSAGVGLGLAIVKRIVAAHKGKVSVTSQIGVGSCFTVSLPAINQVSETIATSTEPTDSFTIDHNLDSSNTLPSPNNITVLLVDDDPINQQVIKQQLNQLGCQVDLAGSSSEALEKFEQQSYHLVLMDYHLPDLDGIKTTGLLRRLFKTNAVETCIVGLSASENYDRRAWQQAGADYFISKPFKKEQIEQLLVLIQESAIVDTYISQPIKSSNNNNERANSNGNNADTLDLNVLRAMQGLFNHHGQVMVQLIDSFLLEMEQSLSELSSTIEANQLKQAELIAHTIRGRSSTFGARRLLNLSVSLEQSLNGDNGAIKSLLLDIKQEFHNVSKILNKEKQKFSGSYV